jgi:hypothetical protein
MPRMAWRMLVLATLVFAGGLALLAAWESLDEPSGAQARSVAEGDLYDCGDFATQPEARNSYHPATPTDWTPMATVRRAPVPWPRRSSRSEACGWVPWSSWRTV